MHALHEAAASMRAEHLNTGPHLCMLSTSQQCVGAPELQHRLAAASEHFIAHRLQPVHHPLSGIVADVGSYAGIHASWCVCALRRP